MSSNIKITVDHNHTIGLDAPTRETLERLADALEAHHRCDHDHHGHHDHNHIRIVKLQFLGEPFMHQVTAETPDFAFDLLVEARNVEGGVVPVSKLDITVASDNESAITVIPDPDGNPLKGTIHVEGAGEDGSDNIANLNVEVRNKKGDLLAAGSEQFVVTSGDATVATVGFHFAIDDQPPTTPVQPPTQ